jgi:hypothetical protein
MAFTTEEYNNLKSAYAKGVLTVEYGDQKVTYRSLSDMEKILSKMETELGIRKKWNGKSLATFKSGL